MKGGKLIRQVSARLTARSSSMWCKDGSCGYGAGRLSMRTKERGSDKGGMAIGRSSCS